MFDIEEIMRNVPHRYPFLLIDRITQFEPGKSCTALKNITINEAQFAGHFPGKPVFPGVYLIENMAQAACFLLVKSAGGIDERKVYFLGKVNRMTFLSPVVPGDQLLTTVAVETKMGDNAVVSGVAKVGDRTVAKGEMMFGVGSS